MPFKHLLPALIICLLAYFVGVKYPSFGQTALSKAGL